MIADWEAAFAPYDEETYRFVARRIQPWDVVLDIGAGDLRLSRRLAAIACRVYAVEQHAGLIRKADRGDWPANLFVVQADALTWPFPEEITVAVLLMRHCTQAHFSNYVARLIHTTHCQRLFTNARWKLGVEEVQLRSAQRYDPERIGWYACQCGAAGFTPGDPDLITTQVLNKVTEVTNCPHCGA